MNSSNADTVPAINKTAFACPHCGAYTTQYWHELYSKSIDCEDKKTPHLFFPDMKDKVLQDFKKINSDTGRTLDKNDIEKFCDWFEKQCSGKPFLVNIDSTWVPCSVNNIHFAKCYNCSEISIWVYDQMVYPCKKIEILPNSDIPEYIKNLFEEARQIVNSSPKGAAALLRLCIQYICKELGEEGRNLDEDIGNLVAKGLNPTVHKALDVVRVIGNAAVHPGEINLNDNREIALQLFDLINLIADQMISHPKKVDDLFNKLPESKRESIEQRNAKKTGKQSQ
jgi:hypothetical protein